MKRAGVVLHADRHEAAATARALVETLLGRGIQVWALDADAQRIDVPGVNPTSQLPEELDLVFVFGGDGTLLRAAEAVGRSGVPLLGINFGHLGFLSEVERSDLDAGLKRLLDNGFIVEERLVLEADVEQGGGVETLRALNDIIVAKVATGRAVRVEVSIGGERLVSWAADGVIVATPTGSTAYSFSAGGPVVSPHLDCLIVTPVSPHGLFARSVIAPADDEVELALEGSRDPASLSADGGQTIKLEPGARIRVRAGKDRIRLAKLEPRPFWRLLREKFRLDAGE
ncbi:MAG TPA: NAD(+)/NADH kinase [Actinomycetota bacterium]|nr:NAD(+)/NADH kinase [Actinomycetota bacterium]